MFTLDTRIADPDDPDSDLPAKVTFTYYKGHRPSLYDPGQAAYVEVTRIQTEDGQEVDWLTEEQIGAIELECFNAAPAKIQAERDAAADNQAADERWRNTQRMARASQTSLFNKKGDING